MLASHIASYSSYYRSKTDLEQCASVCLDNLTTKFSCVLGNSLFYMTLASYIASYRYL